MNHEPDSIEIQKTTLCPVEMANLGQVAPASQTSMIETVADQDEASKESNEETSAACLTRIETTLLDLKQIFEQRFQYDEAKEKRFDLLYEKVKQQESGFQSSLKMNLIRALLLLYDSMVSAEDDLKGHELACDRVQSLKQELLNIFYSEDVEPIGKLNDFNSQWQKVSRTVCTDDSTQHHSIEQIEREGFMFQGKVLRSQTVVIRQYEPPTPDNQQPNNQQNEGE